MVPRRIPCATHDVDGTGEVVVLDAHGERLHVLNPVGAAVFDLADGSRDLAAMVDVLASVFPLPKERLRDDVEAFVADLRERGLIEVASVDE